MIIPNPPMVTDLFASLASILVDNGKGGGGRLGREGFNSLIGIVTAICGNVLISIALNTQRYAHIKLNEQAAERRRLLRRAERRNMESSGHVGSNGQSGQNSGNGRDAKERLQRIQRDYKSKDGRQNGNYPRSSSSDDESDEQRPLLDGYQTPDERVEDESDSNSNAKQDEEASQKSYLKSPYWWAGIIMMTVGEAGNFLAYGFAPASIVSPLGVVAIISNCIIAPIFMKEPFRWRDFFGVVVAVAGAVTVVLSASESNPRLGPHEIWDLIARWEFETYLGITVFVIICLMWASNKYGQKSVFIDLGLVGLFGGYTALSTKGVASLLSYTLFKALTFPVFYLLVAILFGTAVMQIKYINRALQRFDSTQVIPTQFVMFTLSVILGSAVLYRDFEKTRGDAAGKFAGGCAMTFIGVWLITSGRPTPSDDDSDFDEDEEAIVLRPGEQYQDDIHVNSESQETLSHEHLISIEDDEVESRSQSIRRSQVSLPESLERNHWNSAAASGQATPQQPGLDYGTSQSALENSVLVDNPWTTEATKLKGGLQRFLQPLASLFPTQRTAKNTAQALPSVPEARHSTPAIPTINDPEYQNPPRTPRQNSNDATILATNASTGGYTRGHLANRHSLNNLYPGPFTSPLSSSLSAMVSDSLRRSINIKRMRKQPKRPSLSRLGSSTSKIRQRGQSVASEAILSASFSDHDGLLPAFDERRAAQRNRSHSVEEEDEYGARSEPTTPAASNRPRSMSVRLGDFFRRSARNGRETTADDEPPV